MKIAVYPGSFNPMHIGHEYVIKKALTIFDKVIIMKGQNPEKEIFPAKLDITIQRLIDRPEIELIEFSGLLKNAIPENACAIIKGLRNGIDFEYEKAQQYCNEDLNIRLPVFYIIADRDRTHWSSTFVRAMVKK